MFEFIEQFKNIVSYGLWLKDLLMWSLFIDCFSLSPAEEMCGYGIPIVVMIKTVVYID